MPDQKHEKTDTLPACGLYRTTVAMAGKEDKVGEGRLVKFHNHSKQGPPLVLLPQSNEDNRWTFQERGFLVEDDAFLKGLVAVLDEGYYILKEHLHVTKEEIRPEGALVQLGYNPAANPILFSAHFAGNTISFPSTGYRFDGYKVFENLTPAGFRKPKPKPKRVLH